MNRARARHEQQAGQQQIDAVLRRIGGAEPPAALRSRVIESIGARIAQGAVNSKPGWRSFSAPKLVFAAATAVLASAIIVTGSVEHSHRISLPAAGMQFAPAASGLGTASAAHLATRPVKAASNGRARIRRKTNRGRASLTRQIRKPAGVAVPMPDTPAPQR